MSRKFVDKLGRLNPFGSRCKELPKALPVHSSQRLVRVFVEGYEDVAFWQGVFDRFTNPICVSKSPFLRAKTCPRARRCCSE